MYRPTTECWNFWLCFILCATNIDEQSPITYTKYSTFTLCLAKKNAALQPNEAIPTDASTSQVQPVAVVDDTPANAGDSGNPIQEFDNNERNRKIFDELFDLLFEVPDMTGEYLSILYSFLYKI